MVLDVNRRAVRPARSRFDRLHEDEHVLVLDKPAGLLTVGAHDAGSADEDTVLNRVREYMERRRGHRGYVGPLHRLDRDTSGALAVALSREAHEAGRELFGAHAFDRQYVRAGRRRAGRGHRHHRRADRRHLRLRDGAGWPLAGEPSLPAVTHFVVRERFGDARRLLELTLETGRQHQIRLHLQRLGHPVLGDRVYGRAAAGSRCRGRCCTPGGSPFRTR